MYARIGIAMASLFVGCFLDVNAGIDYNQPVDPATYAKRMKQGFAANFVKRFDTLWDPKIVDDVYARGFKNFRLRLPAGDYEYPYDSPEFEMFLNNTETVVDKCLDKGMFVAISWSNTAAGARVSDDDLRDFKAWWVKVAKRLRDKNYMCSINMVTEIGGHCRHTEQGCDISLKNETIYNKWMQEAIFEIRNNTGGNNKERVIILPSPRKSAEGLALIHNETYLNDGYMMAEHHVYAGGPETERQGAYQYWEGNGTAEMRETVYSEIAFAKEYVPELKTCWLAWSPIDIKGGGMDQMEAESFAAHFVSVLKEFKMPWSANQLGFWYDQEELHWITEETTRNGQTLNMSRILDVILENM